MSKQIQRSIVCQILARMERGPRVIQAVVGPRQAGKTTAARSIGEAWTGPVIYAAADLPLTPGPEWIQGQWEQARRLVATGTVLLILDEVQKVQGWSEVGS